MSIEEYYVKTADQLCWSCRNACGGCPWTEIDPDTNRPRFQPVPGWTARLRYRDIRHDGRTHGTVNTYAITACPLFVEDEPRKPERKLNGKDIAAMIALREKGRSFAEIALDFSVSALTACNAIRKAKADGRGSE